MQCQAKSQAWALSSSRKQSTSKSGTTFTWPQSRDETEIAAKDIVTILPKPTWAEGKDLPSEWNLISTNYNKKLKKGVYIVQIQYLYDLSKYLFKIFDWNIILSLVFYINKWLFKGVLPHCLKASRVNPSYKKGDREQASNYKSVTLAPVLGKVLELVVKSQVCSSF